ncbi:MAG: ABC-2 family transporter permease [Minisyncoccota bacterium]
MMMQNDKEEDPLARRVLDRISGEHLVPRPRWEFVFKNYFFWVFGAFAIVLSALAFSATLFDVQNVDWRLSAATHANFLSFFLEAAPFLWVGALIVFMLVSYINVRRTVHGYRYPLAVIALGAVLASLVLGSALFVTGLGGEIEEAIGDHPPFYRPILVEERSWWLAPQKGLLGGRVISLAPNAASFVLRDFQGRLWQVEDGDLRNADFAVVLRGGTVRIVGVPAAATSTTFHACFVFPWEPWYGFFNKPSIPHAPLFASTSERSVLGPRSDICKGIRPYQQLRSIDEIGF